MWPKSAFDLAGQVCSTGVIKAGKVCRAKGMAHGVECLK
jgi:hypothetical protein